MRWPISHPRTPGQNTSLDSRDGRVYELMRDAWCEAIMRTTIAIDDDVLVAAKAIAAHERRTLGSVISDLARKALDRPRPHGSRNGVPLLGGSAGRTPVTHEIVNALRDDLV